MIETTASVTTTGVAHCEASGKIPRQKRSMPKVPILSSTQTSITLTPGVAFSVVSASQVCTGNSGALIAKAMKKPRNSQRPASVEMSSCSRSVEQVGRLALLGRDDVEADDRGEQHEAAGELEHQELHRGGAAALLAEAADEEVRRDQRGLEDDVEEEDVGGAEDRERQGLEREHPGVVGARRLVALVPAGEHHDGRDDDGEQHHEQAETVDAEGVVDAEGLDPVDLLGQLQAACRRRRTCVSDGDAEAEGAGRDADARSSGPRRPAGTGSPGRRRAGTRIRTVNIRGCTASIARATRTTPSEDGQGVGADVAGLHLAQDPAERLDRRSPRP